MSSTAGPLAAADEPAPAAGDAAGRALRTTGLVLVLVLAVALPLVWGMAALFGPPRTVEVEDSIHNDRVIRSLQARVRDVSLLALTGYVLWRQGRGFRSLVAPPRRSDVLWGAALAVLALLPYAVAGLVEHGSLPRWMVGPLTVERMGVGWLAATTFGTAVSCLVFRAYLIEEVVALTDNVPLAVVASVAAEALNDFRFDIPSAAWYLVYTLFFLKTRRATPLVVAMILTALWLGLHHTSGS